MNNAYQTVWNRTTRTYVAVSEVARRRRTAGASVCGTLAATCAGLLGVLTFAQAARADDCTSATQSCVSVAQALAAQVAGTPTAADGSTTAQPIILLTAADTPAVTDYIAVSPNVVQGSRTSASSDLNAMAIGPVAAAVGFNALAVGAGSAAGSDGSTAVGSAAGALSVNSTAVGAGASVGALSDGSIALGYNARSSGLSSASIGGYASATSAGAVAIGYDSFVRQTATNGLAMGSNATATAVGAVALGGGSLADRANVVSLGNSTQTRQIAYVGAGTQATDAVNLGQLAGVAAALGGGASIDANGAVLAPSYTVGGATYSDVGAALEAAITTSVHAGSDAVRYDSPAHDTVTLGNAAVPVQITNVRAGNLAADSSDAVNGSQLFGTNEAVAQNTTNITNLDQRTTTVEGDVSNITNRIANGGIGLVQQDQASRDLLVGKDTDGARVDFTGTAGARELTGIAAGTTDSSAVNVSQIRPVVAALGGGAQINADGSVSAPAYHVQGGTQTTVGDALGSLDSGLVTLQQNLASGGIGVVTQDPLTQVINVGATSGGSLINMAGTAGNRVVTGVAAGAVGPSSSDAVNGSQLYAQGASTAVALGGGATVNPDGTVSAPSYTVGGTVVNSVGGALTSLDGRVTQNSTDIAGLQSTVGSLNGAVANAVQYDSPAHDKVTLGGTAANAPKVQLTNLKEGELSATSTDAVTGAQLYTTNQQISSLGQVINNIQTTGDTYVSVNSSGNAAQAIGNGSVAIGGGAKASAPNSVALGEGSVADQTGTVSVGSSGNERRITNVAAAQAPTDAVNMSQFQSGIGEIARNAYSGTASAIALTMVPEVDATKNLALGVATAGYKGYQAMAVALSARVTSNLKVKVGAGISSATTTVGAGASYQW